MATEQEIQAAITKANLGGERAENAASAANTEAAKATQSANRANSIADQCAEQVNRAKAIEDALNNAIVNKVGVLPTYPIEQPVENTTAINARDQFAKDKEKDDKIKANQDKIVQLEQTSNMAATPYTLSLTPMGGALSKDASFILTNATGNGSTIAVEVGGGVSMQNSIDDFYGSVSIQLSGIQSSKIIADVGYFENGVFTNHVIKKISKKDIGSNAIISTDYYIPYNLKKPIIARFIIENTDLITATIKVEEVASLFGGTSELTKAKVVSDSNNYLRSLVSDTNIPYGDINLTTDNTLVFANANSFYLPKWNVIGTIIKTGLRVDNGGLKVGSKVYFEAFATETINSVMFIENGIKLLIGGEEQWMRVYALSKGNYVLKCDIVINEAHLRGVFAPTSSNDVQFMISSGVASGENVTITLDNVKYGIQESANNADKNADLSIPHLDGRINDLSSKIGDDYNIGEKDPLTYAEIKGTTNRFASGIGYFIQSGTSGKDIELIIGLLNRSKLYDVRLGYTGTGATTFSVKAYTQNGVFIQDVPHYWDNNNGMIRLSIDGRSISTENITVKITNISSVTEGYELSYMRTDVVGEEVVETISNRLIKLEGYRDLFVMSPNGTRYKLQVSDDGILSASASLFGKILYLGHSFANHDALPQIGWYGNWGMAAESQSKDFVHLTQGYLTTKGASELKIVSMTDFEKRHNEPNYDYTSFNYLKNYGADTIIIKVGENVTDPTSFGEHLVKLLKENIIANKANVYIASMWLTSSDTSESVSGFNVELKKVADTFGTKLVMINDNSRIMTAWDTPLPAKPDGSQPNKGEYPTGAGGEVSSGVTGGHPGNNGHKMISDRFINEIKRHQNIK